MGIPNYFVESLSRFRSQQQADTLEHWLRRWRFTNKGVIMELGWARNGSASPQQCRA
jgi:hypothetical protein